MHEQRIFNKEKKQITEQVEYNTVLKNSIKGLNNKLGIGKEQTQGQGRIHRIRGIKNSKNYLKAYGIL